MQTSRRRFFQSAMAIGTAAAAYPTLASCSKADTTVTGLIPDPNELLDLPKGFTYTKHSIVGEVMSDGLTVPASHDGMACFAIDGDPERCVLVRNHELDPYEKDMGPYAKVKASPEQIAKSYALDRDGQPMPGGTTTLVFNLKTQTVEKSFLSLSGTLRNCSGGATPWGSWLTCEETTQTAGDQTNQDHGYMFEVPAMGEGLAEPVALRAMGRFKREAAAVDPRDGIVYQTEDEKASLIYRFIPNVPGSLSAGGKVQALVIKDTPKADTRNWKTADRFKQGDTFPVEWIDLDDVQSPKGDLKDRGHEAGAALFARGEGMAWSVTAEEQAVYFACTTGGAAEAGQIWKYVPDTETLHLVYESQSKSELDMCDNIVAAPWGDLIMCEDGDSYNFVRGVSADGRVYDIARSSLEKRSELAGACFSPDGETMFVNLQKHGITFAIRGPWANLARG